VTRILGLGALPLAVFLSLAAPWPASPAHAQGSPTQIVIAQPAEDFHVGHERRVGLDASPRRSAEQPSNRSAPASSVKQAMMADVSRL